MIRSLRTSVLVLFAVAVSACGTTNVNYVTGQEQRGAYTWQQEVQIGREADQQIVAQYGVYNDAELSAYVDRVAREVLQTSAYTDPATPAEVRSTPFYFRVLDSPVVNAFALPGGYVYVTRGLLAFLNNEAQLSVVLGHEIGHVLARHSSTRAQRAQLGQLGVLGAAVLGGVIGGGRVAEGILNYGSQGAQLLTLSYGRDAEREADRAGVAYAEFAGYDASEASSFFRSLQRLGAESGQALPNFLSSHPDPGERETTIQELAAQYEGNTETNAAEYLRQIDGIVIGDDPRQGYTEGSTFYHPELRFAFDYPPGWNVQNSAQAVTIAQPNNGAALQLTLSQAASPTEAAQAFGAQQGVQVTDNRRLDVNRLPAVRLEGQVAQQQGATQFTATFVELDNRVYQILGIAPSASFNTYANALRSTGASFRRLTDRRYLDRQAVRLSVETAPSSTTLQELLRGRTIPEGLNPLRFAIMNEVDLTTSIPRGAAVKLPTR